MIELRTIYPVTQEALDFLYDLLTKREAGVSISHKKMPTKDEHADFVCSIPRRKWWLVYAQFGDEACPGVFDYRNIPVGSAYLSKQNEIGIHIMRTYQGRGFGLSAVRKIIAMFPGERLLANVSPGNEKSHKLFKGVGGIVIQHTYEILA